VLLVQQSDVGSSLQSARAVEKKIKKNGRKNFSLGWRKNTLLKTLVRGLACSDF